MATEQERMENAAYTLVGETQCDGQEAGCWGPSESNTAQYLASDLAREAVARGEIGEDMRTEFEARLYQWAYDKAVSLGAEML